MNPKINITTSIIVVLISMVICVPNTFAATTDPTIIDTLYTGFGVVLNIIYLITLPILMIAGKAMDNSMLYGEFLNLDKPLYMLWNISRTFANFMIGGVFLYNILRYIFTERSDNIAEVKNIVIKGAIAALAINFSWFALGAVIDLSTILTYSLGSMPLSILNQFRASEHDMPILSINTFLNYSNQTVKNHIYYQRDGTNGTINIPQCGWDGKTYKGFITGPEYYSTIPGNSTALSFETSLKNKFCAVNTKTLVDTTDIIQRKEDNILTSAISNSNGSTGADQQYHTIIKSLIDKVVESTGSCSNISLITENGTSLDFDTQSFAKALPSFGEVKYCDGTLIMGGSDGNNILSYQKKWKESFIKKLVAPDEGPYPGYNNPEGLSLSNLLDSSKGMVGPFVTLYVTLLDFSNLSIGEVTDENAAKAVGGLVEFFLRAIIGVMLMIPLIALAVALIVRVGIIRIIIAFMPLGIALKALDISTPSGGDGPLKSITGNLNAKGILGLIFAPVIPVFVLSISIIFIQALQGQLGQDISTPQNQRDFLGMEFVKQKDPSITCADFWGLQEICYKNEDNVSVGSVFTDLFPWIFVNIFAIAIMRFLVKAAINASPMTAEISGGIMDIGQKLITSIPIIPIPGIGRVGLGTASTIPDKVLRTAGTKAEKLDKAGQDRLEKRIASLGNYFSDTPPSGNENTPPPSRTTFSTESKEAIKQEIIKNNPTSTKEIIEKVTNTATTESDKQEARRLGSLTGGTQAEEVIGHINEIFEGEKNKEALAIKVFTEKLRDVADIVEDSGGNITSINVQNGKEKDLEKYINLPNINKIINNNTQLKGYLQTLTYKDNVTGISYNMGGDLKRTEKTQ